MITGIQIHKHGVNPGELNTMSLEHEFFLLSNDFDIDNVYEWYDYNRYTWREKASISDHMILYLMDFLNWIPTYSPATKQSTRGLTYYGLTIISATETGKLKQILEKWLSFIEEAPDIFSLSGETVWKEAENEEGYWESTRTRVHRDALQHELQALIDLTTKASNSNKFILHFGI